MVSTVSVFGSGGALAGVVAGSVKSSAAAGADPWYVESISRLVHATIPERTRFLVSRNRDTSCIRPSFIFDLFLIDAIELHDFSRRNRSVPSIFQILSLGKSKKNKLALSRQKILIDEDDTGDRF